MGVGGQPYVERWKNPLTEAVRSAAFMLLGVHGPSELAGTEAELRGIVEGEAGQFDGPRAEVSAAGWPGTSMPTEFTEVTLLIRSLPGAAGSAGIRAPMKSPAPRAR